MRLRMAAAIILSLMMGACCNPGANCSLPPPSAYNNANGGA